MPPIRRTLIWVLTIVLLPPGTTRAAEITLHITDPDGKSAAGAAVAVVPAGRRVIVTEGRTLDEDPNYTLGKTDAQGHVSLTTSAADFLVIVIHETGYANLDRDTALKTTALRLAPWGRIEGKMMVGTSPARNEPVSVQVRDEFEARAGEKKPGWLFVNDTTTDAQGNFVVERLPAGRVQLAPGRKLWNFTSYARPMVKIDVRAGETSTVTLGGRGRPVAGKVNTPQSLRSVPDWQFVYCLLSLKVQEVPAPVPAEVKALPLREQAAWWQSFRGSEEDRAHRRRQNKGYELQMAHTYPFEVAKDGTFRIENVAPGRYTLSIGAMVPFREGRPGKDLGTTSVEVTIEPFDGERTDDVQTLPPIDWKAAEEARIAVGEPAPDFSVPGFDGKTIKLSDFGGKFVVLDFWATWCGPCVEEMPNLIEAHRAFAPTGTIEFISLSLDSEPDAPLAFIQREKLDWHHGYLGDWDTDPVSKSYGVNGIPSLWLIGPDGKVLARGLRGDEVLLRIDEAIIGNARTSSPPN